MKTIANRHRQKRTHAMGRWLWGAACLGLITVSMAIPDHRSAFAEAYPNIFRFGVLNMLSGVHPKDAKVAVEMNFVRSNKESLPDIRYEFKIIDNVADAANLFAQDKLHGISLSGIDYLALKEKVALRPLFISSRVEAPLEAYVLLSRKNVANLQALSMNPKRRLMLEDIGETHVGQLWLDTVLREKGFGSSRSFFTAIRPAEKPTRMVLPVFFGQAEACLVPESTYTAMIELNPQIAKQIRVLMRSPKFVRAVTCVSADVHPDLRDAVQQNAIDMPNKVNGEQLMLIFQYRRHFRFDPAYMKETERIYKLFQKSRKKGLTPADG